MTREYTNKVLEAVAEGTFTAQMVMEACLTYMSEDDVKDMAQCNKLLAEDANDDEGIFDDMWYLVSSQGIESGPYDSYKSAREDAVNEASAVMYGAEVLETFGQI